MKIISKAQDAVLKILGKPKLSDSGYRLIKYCVQETVDEGVLLFNVLTRELVLLSNEEFESCLENQELISKWFLVPCDFNEKAVAEVVRWTLENVKEKPKNITTYTILPTSECNARCFYCFEHGQKKEPMTVETALKTVEYIKKHSGDEKISISWFGGEPLYNLPVIDLITSELQKAGIEFTSRMISNGYLFDDETAKKAAEKWKLKSVQITLDGTEEVYNKTKAYIYKDTNPFQVVLSNIERLLDAKIFVIIRLNMDLYNAENLMELVDQLALRFEGKKGIAVYANHIFDANVPMAELHNEEEWAKREKALIDLEEKILRYNLSKKLRIAKKHRLNHCMVDNGSSALIVPSGDIGLCEHYLDREFIGHIDKEGFDKEMVASWKERTPEIPECNDCFFYPECIVLKKCTANSVCYKYRRETSLRDTKQKMLNEYKAWQEKAEEMPEEDIPIC